MPQEKGAPATFRFPDRDVRTLFNLQETVFPGGNFSTTHFCGLPRFVTFAFKLVKPFMSREAYEAMVLKPSFSHLGAHGIPNECMLRRWSSHGTFAFDVDEYIEWRAREEGVDLADICPRGHGRAFDVKAAAKLQAAALSESMQAAGGSGISAKALIDGQAAAMGAAAAPTTAPAEAPAVEATPSASSVRDGEAVPGDSTHALTRQLDAAGLSQAAAEPAASAGSEAAAVATATVATAVDAAAKLSGGALKHGVVEKRGSGKGLFSTTRWKRKLLVLSGFGVAYFDEIEIAEENRAAAIVPLDGTCKAEALGKPEAKGGPAFQFTLKTAAREFLFGVHDASELEAWVAAINKRCEAIDAARTAPAAETADEEFV